MSTSIPAASSARPLRLVYFDIPGRAFAARAALRHARVPFEDARVAFPDLGKLRGERGFNERVPLGSLPVLELPDGRVIAQSTAIAKYAGRLANLWPTNPVDELVCDSVMETANELLTKVPRHPDPAELKRVRVEFAQPGKDLDKYLSAIDALVKGPFILGATQITVADLYVQHVVHTFTTGVFDHIPTDVVQTRYPKLAAFRDAVRAHPICKAEIDFKL